MSSCGKYMDAPYVRPSGIRAPIAVKIDDLRSYLEHSLDYLDTDADRAVVEHAVTTLRALYACL